MRKLKSHTFISINVAVRRDGISVQGSACKSVTEHEDVQTRETQLMNM